MAPLRRSTSEVLERERVRRAVRQQRLRGTRVAQALIDTTSAQAPFWFTAIHAEPPQTLFCLPEHSSRAMQLRLMLEHPDSAMYATELVSWAADGPPRSHTDMDVYSYVISRAATEIDAIRNESRLVADSEMLGWDVLVHGPALLRFLGRRQSGGVYDRATASLQRLAAARYRSVLWDPVTKEKRYYDEFALLTDLVRDDDEKSWVYRVRVPAYTLQLLLRNHFALVDLRERSTIRGAVATRLYYFVLATAGYPRAGSRAIPFGLDKLQERFCSVMRRDKFYLAVADAAAQLNALPALGRQVTVSPPGFALDDAKLTVTAVPRPLYVEDPQSLTPSGPAPERRGEIVALHRSADAAGAEAE